MAQTNIFGALGVADNDVAYLSTFGQEIVYEATSQVLSEYNADLERAEALFIERETEAHEIKYKLPLGGFLQRRDNRSRPGEVKPNGEWMVQFPLEDFGADIAMDYIAFAKLTLEQWDLDLAGIMEQDGNTRRFEMLKALFNNTSRPIVDEDWPNLGPVMPLANNDGTIYPPVIGSYSNAQANNYLGVPANATAINNSNDPFPLIVQKLEKRFGQPSGGSKIAIFMNGDQVGGAETLATFNPVPNRFVEYGANANLVDNREQLRFPLPGRVVGEADNALLCQWDWLPTGYLFGIHFGAPAPLLKRVDPAKYRLGRGLQMRADDAKSPFKRYTWTNRYGLGVGNRLNGVAVDLTAAGGAGTYTIPPQFAA